jgi:hypothetical protein
VPLVRGAALLFLHLRSPLLAYGGHTFAAIGCGIQTICMMIIIQNDDRCRARRQALRRPQSCLRRTRELKVEICASAPLRYTGKTRSDFSQPRSTSALRRRSFANPKLRSALHRYPTTENRLDLGAAEPSSDALQLFELLPTQKPGPRL